MTDKLRDEQNLHFDAFPRTRARIRIVKIPKHEHNQPVEPFQSSRDDDIRTRWRAGLTSSIAFRCSQKKEYLL
jgi:hypothetical protein